MLEKRASNLCQSLRESNTISFLNGSLKAIEHLLSRGSPVNAEGGIYSSMLQTAAVYGHDEAIKILQRNNADQNARGGK